MDIDNIVKFWFIDVPYIYLHNDDFKKCRRYYFIHENTVVYARNSVMSELYTYLNNKDQQDLYIIPYEDEFCLNYFMVCNPYSLTWEHDIRMNGKKIEPERNYDNVYEFLWDISTRESIDTYCSVYKIMGNDGEILTPGKNIITACNKKLGMGLPVSIDYKYIDEAQKVDMRKYEQYNKTKYKPRNRNDEFVTELSPNFPEKKYIQRYKLKDPNIHWGQVKLLFSEIEFLIKYLTVFKSKIVVYAGAAGGDHIPILSKMFPYVLFILYDPAKFSIQPTPNIIIRNEYFTNEIALLYKNFKIIFISDIRVVEGQKVQEQQIDIDNKMQKEWVDNADPWKAILKFRTPYYNGQTLYYEGNQYFQTFAPEQSGETRLVPSKSIRKYDHTTHERKMFYFNTEYRNRSFADYHEFFGVNYDTYRVYVILYDYIKFSSLYEKYKEFSSNRLVLALIFYIEDVLKKKKITELLF